VICDARSLYGNVDRRVHRGVLCRDTACSWRSCERLVHELAPDATETISYAIPTFDLGGKHLVHFAGYEKHVGLYPAPSGMEAFKGDLKAYKTGKGSVQFPLEEPLPVDLIRRIVAFRVAEMAPGG